MRRLIYLFDSATSINSLQLVSFFRKREPGLELVAILDASIADPGKLSVLFDRYYVVPTAADPLDPCPMTLTDVAEAAGVEFGGCGDIRVIAYGEYTPLLAAQLRERFALDGMSVVDALAFRDKLVMKSVVGRAVRVPVNACFERDRFSDAPEAYLESLGRRLGWPLVVKPVNAASALGARVITCERNVATVVAGLQEFGGAFEAESFIKGTLLHCEIVFRDGRPLVSCCSRFNLPVLALAEGACVGSIPLLPDDALAVRVVEFCERALAQTGIRDGITHTELFLSDDNELVFLETAARCPGGRVIEAYIETLGINLLDVDQRVRAGLPVSVHCEPTGRGAYWAVIPKKAGRVLRLGNHELEGACDIRTFFEVGDVMQGESNFEQIFGVVLVRAPTYPAACRDFKKVADAAFFDVETVGAAGPPPSTRAVAV